MFFCAEIKREQGSDFRFTHLAAHSAELVIHSKFPLFRPHIFTAKLLTVSTMSFHGQLTREEYFSKKSNSSQKPSLSLSPSPSLSLSGYDVTKTRPECHLVGAFTLSTGSPLQQLMRIRNLRHFSAVSALFARQWTDFWVNCVISGAGQRALLAFGKFLVKAEISKWQLLHRGGGAVL